VSRQHFILGHEVRSKAAALFDSWKSGFRGGFLCNYSCTNSTRQLIHQNQDFFAKHIA